MNLIDHQLLENEAWIANFGVDAAESDASKAFELRPFPDSLPSQPTRGK